MFRLLTTFLLLCAGACAQQPVVPVPTAESIMARVAMNQDAANSERAHFLYTQHAHAVSRTGKTVRCEETTDTRILPQAKGSTRKLLALDGRLLHKGTYLHYTQLDVAKKPHKEGAAEGEAEDDDRDINISVHDDENDTMDRDLLENLRDHLTSDKSKDGVSAGLFPLTSAAQASYTFKLLGRERRNGRDCFHVIFAPKDTSDYGWKGDAWIDTAAYQPVVVRTALSRNIPFAVRTLLGTSAPGLGFTVVYAPQPVANGNAGTDALWFPVSVGTEFKVHVLFFLNRQITLSAENRDFERTHVTSTIEVPRP